MTTAYHDAAGPLTADAVYPPQHDSQLLLDVMARLPRLHGLKVADLCTGSGVVALAAAACGAEVVLAFDLSPAAVRHTRTSALVENLSVEVHLGPWTRAAEFGRYDLVVANPPYVPQGCGDGSERIPATAGPALAFNGGPDGRLVLDPLCRQAPRLLRRGGALLVVQSEFADVTTTIALLRNGGLRADVAARRTIPFGPVMSARARWLERTGRLQAGRRTEGLVVIRAVRP